MASKGALRSGPSLVVANGLSWLDVVILDGGDADPEVLPLPHG